MPRVSGSRANGRRHDTALTTASFVAMGNCVTVAVNGPVELHAHARRRIDQLERLWSRFIPDSEIATMNMTAGRPRRVDPSTIRLVTAMVDGWRATRGAFDPTLLPSLVAVGGGCSLRSPTHTSVLAVGSLPRGMPDLIEIDPLRCEVTLPAFTTLDAGGIGKGLAADIVADELVDAGAAGALIDIGGDIAVRGDAASGAGWKIAVGDSDPQTNACVRLLRGGVATSGTERRCWPGAGGTGAHHLIDPQRLVPFDAVAREATVIAGTAAWAEVWTKAVIAASSSGLSALRAELQRLDTLGLAARARTACGAIEHNECWAAFTPPGGEP